MRNWMLWGIFSNSSHKTLTPRCVGSKPLIAPSRILRCSRSLADYENSEAEVCKMSAPSACQALNIISFSTVSPAHAWKFSALNTGPWIFQRRCEKTNQTESKDAGGLLSSLAGLNPIAIRHPPMNINRWAIFFRPPGCKYTVSVAGLKHAPGCHVALSGPRPDFIDPANFFYLCASAPRR